MANLNSYFENLYNSITEHDIELLVLVAIVVVVLFILWLLMRSTRLWYWKINDKASLLKSLDQRLANIEDKQNQRLANIEDDQMFVANRANIENTNQTLEIPSNKNISEENRASASAIGTEGTSNIVDKTKAENDNNESKKTNYIGEHKVIDKIEKEASIANSEANAETFEDETYTAKSGRVYSKKELEAIIRE